jgi:hypothetical protein
MENETTFFKGLSNKPSTLIDLTTTVKNEFCFMRIASL